jgi:hypothetical protein
MVRVLAHGYSSFSSLTEFFVLSIQTRYGCVCYPEECDLNSRHGCGGLSILSTLSIYFLSYSSSISSSEAIKRPSMSNLNPFGWEGCRMVRVLTHGYSSTIFLSLPRWLNSSNWVGSSAVTFGVGSDWRLVIDLPTAQSPSSYPSN